jgi:hypothetical protein
MTAPAYDLMDLLPVMPTSARAFAQDDIVLGYLRVYQHDLKAPDSLVTIDGTITDGRARVLRRWTAPVAADLFVDGLAE